MSSISTPDSDGNNSIGRRLSTWRRLMLAFGPPSAKQVALALSEFAWPDGNDPDGDLIVKHCTQRILCKLCDYKHDRALRKQLERLQQAGWIERDDAPTGPHMPRQYFLLRPTWLPEQAIAELSAPSRGMWRRVLEANTARTPAREDRRYQTRDCHADEERRSSGAGDIETPALARTNTGPEEPKHRLSGTGLKESSSSSIGVSSEKEGTRQARARTTSCTKSNGLSHVSSSVPDHKNGEPALQDEKSRRQAQSTAYRREAVLRLAKQDYGLQDIARIAGMPTSDVATIVGNTA